MKPPLFVRTLTDEEQQTLLAGLRSLKSDAFTLRRCQILLASSRGQLPSEIAANLGCATQTVRNAINDFHTEGLDCLKPGSSRPKTVQPIFDPAKAEQLRAILHQSPRTFDKPTSVWTLSLAAEVCLEQGVTERLVSIERIRVALKRLGVGWKRAKHWITSPDPEYERKKTRTAK
ncbi:MAG: helix-turn-helix domain-containing protein [Chloroflexi bacterium]|nr:helix-turn-helix domain-containing protein [Chloroflexota bacterium]